MNLRHKVLQRITWKVFRPRPSNQQRPQNLIGLLRIQIAEGVLEFFFGLRLDPIEPKLIQLLAIAWRDTKQKIEELRRLRFERTRVVLDRRHQHLGQLA